MPIAGPRTGRSPEGRTDQVVHDINFHRSVAEAAGNAMRDHLRQASHYQAQEPTAPRRRGSP